MVTNAFRNGRTFKCTHVFSCCRYCFPMLESKAFPDLFIPVLCFFEKKRRFYHLRYWKAKPHHLLIWFSWWMLECLCGVSPLHFWFVIVEVTHYQTYIDVEFADVFVCIWKFKVNISWKFTFLVFTHNWNETRLTRIV